MADTAFLTTTHISPTRTTKLFADNGTADGNITAADILGLIQASDIPASSIPTPAFTGHIVTSGATATFATGETVLSIRKTTPSVTTISLPANPTSWSRYTVIDAAGVAATYNITINTSAGAFIAVIINNFESADFLYDGTGWNRV